MQEITLKPSNKPNKKFEAIVEIIKCIIMSKNASNTRCASYMPGDAKLELKISRE